MGRVICKAKHFTVEILDKPHVSRLEGGHLVIRPKKKVVDRSDLSKEQAIELMKLTMLFGKAMMVGLKKRGIKMGRINYQDNGNWALLKGKGHLHVHLYGRAKDSVIQQYGEALYFPPKGSNVYNHTEPLNAGDVKAILTEVKKFLAAKKYRGWH